MDDRCVRELSALNLRFYDRHAREFSSSRARPWPGWIQLLPHLEEALRASERPLILDAGSGNGRFARWLAETIDLPVRALCLDASLPLLRCRPAGLRWAVLADVVATGGALPVAAASCDAVVLMGLLHHVPSTQLRAGLVRSAAGCLRNGGVLALTGWRFADRERFRRRLAPWSLCPAVSVDELEAGDHLLRWGRGDAVRYCHHFDDAELDGLLNGEPFRLAAGWEADGVSDDLNLYRVWRRVDVSTPAE